MKKTILYGIVFLFSLTLSGQNVPESDRAAIEGYVKKMTYFDIQPLVSNSLQAVFTGNFYKVHQAFRFDTSGTYICQDIKFNVSGSNVSYLEELTNDMVLNSLPGLVRRDFLLKDENAAAKFELAINAFYPAKESEKDRVKHMKKNDRWIFIRGKFFDDYEAIIVTVDPKGGITKIEFKLSYKM